MPAEFLSSFDERLLRIVGRMPLISAEELAAIVGVRPDQLEQELSGLRLSGWLTSAHRGMLETPRERWLLTSRSVEQLYTTSHAHASPREIARAGGLERLRADPSPLGPRNEEFALDHQHMPHIESGMFSPFVDPAVGLPVLTATGIAIHEHPPWTATARGQQICLRRLASLELIYRLVPTLFKEGMLLVPPGHPANPADLHLTDFRLLRGGGYFHAIAHYADDIWISFTYLGLHATERIVRRKQEHRFWGLDCYVAEEDRYFRIANRVFYENPQQTVEPSAQVILTTDSWAAELARRLLVRTSPMLIYTQDGNGTEPVEVRRSLDFISDPAHHPSIGRNTSIGRWWNRNPDLEAINGPTAFRLFMAIAEYPAMRSSWLREIVGGSLATVKRTLDEFVESGLAEVFDHRYFLAERGMMRAANLSRLRRETIQKRHGAYFNPGFRHQEFHHNDGVNRLVLQFANEGVTAFGGWRGELNLRDITQIKPDLILLVSDGPFGARPHCLEYERSAVRRSEVARKLSTYRKSALSGLRVPVLVVCETEEAVHQFLEVGKSLPLLATHLSAALAGPLTGDSTVWRQSSQPTASKEVMPNAPLRLRC